MILYRVSAATLFNMDIKSVMSMSFYHKIIETRNKSVRKVIYSKRFQGFDTPFVNTIKGSSTSMLRTSMYGAIAMCS